MRVRSSYSFDTMLRYVVETAFARHVPSSVEDALAESTVTSSKFILFVTQYWPIAEHAEQGHDSCVTAHDWFSTGAVSAATLLDLLGRCGAGVLAARLRA